MTDAFVNIEASEEPKRVAQDVGEIEPVTESHAVKGQYEVLARIRDVEGTDLQRTVTGLIQEVDGVEDTTTLVVDD